MKNIIKLSLLLLLATNASSQTFKATIVYTKYNYSKYDVVQADYGRKQTAILNIKPIIFAQYQIEDVLYYEVLNAVPQSDIAFYSNKGGGSVLKKITSDKAGKAIMEKGSHPSAAFAVNIKNKSKAGIAGSGMVSFAKEKIFEVKQIILQKNAFQKNVLNWKAAVIFENASFEIQKSVDGNSFATVKTIDAISNKELRSFSFVDETNESGIYRLLLINKEMKNNYLIKDILVPEFSTAVRIYPSPVVDNLNVLLTPAIQKADYQILDNAGKQLLQGQVTQKVCTISLVTLAKGMYFIKIITNNKTEIKRFVKN